jgi:hypothetical protein
MLLTGQAAASGGHGALTWINASDLKQRHKFTGPQKDRPGEVLGSLFVGRSPGPPRCLSGPVAVTVADYTMLAGLIAVLGR